MKIHKTDKNNDIPYEVRMKYIIEDYRKLLKAKNTLTAYAKRLERRVEELLAFIRENGLTPPEQPNPNDEQQ